MLSMRYARAPGVGIRRARVHARCTPVICAHLAPHCIYTCAPYCAPLCLHCYVYARPAPNNQHAHILVYILFIAPLCTINRPFIVWVGVSASCVIERAPAVYRLCMARKAGASACVFRPGCPECMRAHACGLMCAGAHVYSRSMLTVHINARCIGGILHCRHHYIQLHVYTCVNACGGCPERGVHSQHTHTALVVVTQSV